MLHRDEGPLETQVESKELGAEGKLRVELVLKGGEARVADAKENAVVRLIEVCRGLHIRGVPLGPQRPTEVRLFLAGIGQKVPGSAQGPLLSQARLPPREQLRSVVPEPAWQGRLHRQSPRPAEPVGESHQGRLAR